MARWKGVKLTPGFGSKQSKYGPAKVKVRSAGYKRSIGVSGQERGRLARAAISAQIGAFRGGSPKLGYRGPGAGSVGPRGGHFVFTKSGGKRYI